MPHLLSRVRDLRLDGNSLTIEDTFLAEKNRKKVSLSKSAAKKMERSRSLVEKWLVGGEVIYGVTTGFGEFATVKIPHEKIKQLQVNLIRSHSAGTGDPLPANIVRLIILLRANALAKGYSGVRPEVVQLLLEIFNLNLVPFIPEKGSVGSSGDLVQLAHLVLALIGEGSFIANGKLSPAEEVLRKHHLKPLELTAKEGLALVNGTQMMGAFAVHCIYEAAQLAKIFDIVGALSVEALRGTDVAFDARIHKLRPYHGQKVSAKNVRRLLVGSEIRKSHLHNDPRVQDAYSLRCMPQVHGAVRDTIEFCEKQVNVEINSATDNPLIFADDRVHLEGGNFHGEPLALACDFLAIGLSEFASISERRTERMVNWQLSGLPKFLIEDGGLNSGMMIAQYTAASLVSENKVLSHPGSVDSIPTSANQEDHNSMGSVSAQKCYRVLENVWRVAAIELLVACQAIDFSRRIGGDGTPLKCGGGTESVYQLVRTNIKHLDSDRVLYKDIEAALQLLKSGEVITAAEKVVGKLD
ncbi:MAG TPA: histidine ammonia-lyase [Candidatus Acidoferrales bacterium]|nr:histidine ammonia-lyase [Candidatus Acidoferrales bacterium]